MKCQIIDEWFARNGQIVALYRFQVGFNATTGGLAALRSRWAVGNAQKLSDEHRQDLFEKLEQYNPEQVIAPDVRVERGTFWTMSDLEIVVEKWYGVRYRSPTSYRTLLHASGLSYQKVEKVYRSQPGEVQ